MAKIKTVFNFGVNLPNVDGFVSLSLTSDRSMLDADIILIRPSFSEFASDGYFQGDKSLNDNDSFRIQNAYKSWSDRITKALNAGALIVYMLPPKERISIDTGERSYSGTGRNRQTTRHVASFDNYRFIPLNNERNKPSFEHGAAISRTRDIGPLSTIYARFEDDWRYNCYYDPSTMKAALTTTAGRHCVGSIARTGIVFLPDLPFSDEYVWSDGAYYRSKPTKNGTALAFALRDELISLHEAMKASAGKTPAPTWSKSPEFMLPTEGKLAGLLTQAQTRLAQASAEVSSLENQLEEAGALRDLLFETGPRLESAVRLALSLLGFEVSSFNDGKSEFDVVFEGGEGRFIGEVEGRESRSINVAKISQLRRNIDEDFSRDEIGSPAIGVLFGNGHRLDSIDSREACFTDKVTSSAPALGIALVNTVDLFGATQYFLKTNDVEFATQCRRAIADSVGEIVRFPIVHPIQT